MTMQVSESEARDWYEKNGIADTPWEDFEQFTKLMIGVETITSSWDDVHTIREVGIPEDAVVLTFVAEDIVPDVSRVHEESQDRLRDYVQQETTSSNVEKLFNSNTVKVFGVTEYIADDNTVYVRIEVEGNESLFN